MMRCVKENELEIERPDVEKALRILVDESRGVVRKSGDSGGGLFVIGENEALQLYISITSSPPFLVTAKLSYFYFSTQSFQLLFFISGFSFISDFATRCQLRFAVVFEPSNQLFYLFCCEEPFDDLSFYRF